MCSALVSPHGFKNDVYFTCSVCLFRVMAERYFLSRANWLPRVRLTLARKSCLHRIRSSLFANFFNPLAPVNPHFRYHWSSAMHPFPVPVAIRLNPPASKDNPTQVECIGHVCRARSNIKWSKKNWRTASKTSSNVYSGYNRFAVGFFLIPDFKKTVFFIN